MSEEEGLVLKVVQLYVEHGADVSEIDSSGRSVVQRLIGMGNLQSVRWLAWNINVQDLTSCSFLGVFASKINVLARLDMIQAEQREGRESYEQL